jgi:hypothetical protein
MVGSNRVHIPIAIIRKIKTPLGCTLVARMFLLLFGLFCIFIPRVLLTYEILPARYKALSFLGGILYYTGIIVVIIAVNGVLRIVFQAWKSVRSP